MSAIIRLFWQICRFQLGPESVPASKALLAVTGLVYFFLNTAVWWWIGSDGLLEVSITLASATAVWLAIVWTVLLFKRRTSRLPQCVCALLGVNVVMSLVGLPIQWLLTNVTGGTELSLLLNLLLLAILIWGIFVEGFIYHRTLDISFQLGALMALSITMVLMRFLA